MKEPVLEVRGSSLAGWLVASWPFGYLQIYDDHIEITSNYIHKEHIFSITTGSALWFLPLPRFILFLYKDPIGKKLCKIAFLSGNKYKILSTLKDLGYPIKEEIPFIKGKFFSLWRG